MLRDYLPAIVFLILGTAVGLLFATLNLIVGRRAPNRSKVEPYEWRAVYAETTGTLTRLDLREGAPVTAGALLATVTDPELQGEIEAADAFLSAVTAFLGG